MKPSASLGHHTVLGLERMSAFGAGWTTPTSVMRESVDDVRVRAADDPASLLIVILDTSVDSWIEATGKPAAGAVRQAVLSIQSVTEQLLVFINTFLLLHESNRVAVIISSSAMTELVYPGFPPVSDIPADYSALSEDDLLNSASSQIDEQVRSSDPDESLHDLHGRVVNGVKRSIHLQEQHDIAEKPLTITSALATALCLFNRARRIRASRATVNDSIGQNGDSVDQAKHSNGRILHISCSQDDPRQYVPIMNCIFSAQRIGVLIDTCILARQDSTYFQQAAHLTKGVYVKPQAFTTTTPDTLIQVLHSIFLVDKQSRDFLAMPTPEKVDFRASCLQTKKIIDNGYTCSVCLSTFDVSVSKPPIAICPVCSARYTPSTQRRQPRRP